MINITFPDGSVKNFDSPVDGFAVARSISEGFSRNCVAMESDGKLLDLSAKISSDAKVRFLTTGDRESVDILRHSAAHAMAQAKRKSKKSPMPSCQLSGVKCPNRRPWTSIKENPTNWR